MCSFLVSSFLTKVTQHIHSLRARGVRSSHIASAALSEVRAFRKSVGTVCTTPGEIVLLILLFYQAPVGEGLSVAPRPALRSPDQAAAVQQDHSPDASATASLGVNFCPSRESLAKSDSLNREWMTVQSRSAQACSTGGRGSLIFWRVASAQARRRAASAAWFCCTYMFANPSMAQTTPMRLFPF